VRSEPDGRAPGRRWGAFVPERWAWLRVLGSPSSFLLLLAVVVTAFAKLRVISAVEGVVAWPLWWSVSVAPDAALCAALAALFARGERRVPWLMAATIPLAALVAAIAVINGGYLGITGEQLTWQTFALGLARFGDVSGIVGEEAARLGWRAPVGALVLLGIPAASLWLLRRSGRSIHPVAAPGRAHAALLCAAVAALVALAAPRSHVFAVDQLRSSAVLHTYWGWVTHDPDERPDQEWFEGYDPAELVEPRAIDALAAARSPNVVLLVMESTGRDSTSLTGARGLARTPNLQALAAGGLEMTGARAVVPHTTKSLFTVLCGRLPLMQLALLETTSAIQLQCLPSILRAAGWRTAFFQSSLGVFEDRPRLVRKLGFAWFAAWEDIGGEPLGYLASDDQSLAGALAAWLDRSAASSAGPGPRPFFATLLTSATHHPYRLSAAAAARARAAGSPTETDSDRHARLIEEEDRLLGSVRKVLRQRGLDGRTVIVAIGDHGEGFGDKGIRQHDNDFFEEGLHVPWVMAGPGVRHAVVGGEASLVDVTPTILDLLGVSLAPAAARATPGRSLLGGAPREPRLLVFSCWYDERCRGFVEAGRKVVFVPEADRGFWFDLAADPDERDPRRLTAELTARLGQAHHLIDAHRTPAWPEKRDVMTDYPPWSCPADQPCRHPKSPPKGLFTAP